MDLWKVQICQGQHDEGFVLEYGTHDLGVRRFLRNGSVDE